MSQLSLPILVVPLSCAVPRLRVTDSKMSLRSPISRVVGSPAYFLSWGSADGCEGVDAVFAADAGRSLDHNVRADDRPGGYLHVRADDAEGADTDAAVEPGLGIDDGLGVDAAHSSCT